MEYFFDKTKSSSWKVWVRPLWKPSSFCQIEIFTRNYPKMHSDFSNFSSSPIWEKSYWKPFRRWIEIVCTSVKHCHIRFQHALSAIPRLSQLRFLNYSDFNLSYQMPFMHAYAVMHCIFKVTATWLLPKFKM